MSASDGQGGDMGTVAFAVVIPLYNKRPHIARALSSAIRQSHPAKEIIVVDDSSTDGGLEVVREFDDPRIRILHRDEPGPGGYAARNLAIEYATAEWIAFLDADDEWDEGHLAALAGALEAASNPARVHCLFSGYRSQNAGGQGAPDPYTARHGRDGGRMLDFADLLRTWLALRACPIWTSACAFRRSALMEAGLFPAGRCRRGGDKDLWLRATRGGTALAVSAISATYHRDAVNMVTAKEKTNTRHCLCATVAALQAEETPEVAALLRRLLNQEILQYALEATRGGQVSASLKDDYYAADGRLGALALGALATGPGAWSVHALRRLRDRLRG